MAPFTVLHVCMGNICRSPMAERLLLLAAEQRLAKTGAAVRADELLSSLSAGTGGWHQGEQMNPPAARQLKLRGARAEGFAARRLVTAHLAEADLILTATADQTDYVLALRPEVADRTFVLRHFGRLLSTIDPAQLPPVAAERRAVHERGTAMVAAVASARAGAEPTREDDLDDPWGRGDQTFQRVADEIDDVMYAILDILLPAEGQPATDPLRHGAHG